MLLDERTIATICFTVLILAPARSVHATSCASNIVMVTPHDGARNVALDPGLVVSLGTGHVVAAALVDEDGESAPLEIVRKLAATNCCPSQLFFMHASRLLAADTTYYLRVSLEGDDTSQPSTKVMSAFTTGGDSSLAAAPQPPDVHHVRITFVDGAKCGPKRCVDQSELLVADATKETTPSWLVVRAPDVPTSRGAVFGLGQGLFDDGVASVAFPLSEDACIEYEQVNTRGDTVAQGKVCKADRCAVYDPGEVISGVECSALDSARSVAWKIWDELDEKSCVSPPHLRFDATTGKLERVGDRSDSGCSLSTLPTQGALGAAWCLAGVWGLLQRRGRR